MPIFMNVFFFGEEKINRFEFSICYYSRLEETKKFFFKEI